MLTDSADLVPSRVFGHGPFCEIGKPSMFAPSPSGVIAVGGSLGWPQWNGFNVGAGPANETGPLRGWHRCGIYDNDGNCRALVPSRWPIRCAAFNQDGSVLAVGTGSYDGGYCFEGELLIIDPVSGSCSSVLRYRREVLELEWLDESNLRVVVSQAYEEDEPQEPSEYVLEAEDWLDVPAKAFALSAQPRYLPTFEHPDRHAADRQADVERRLAEVASAAGTELGLRRQVWAVQATDFGVVAALEGVEIEAWEEAGDVRYRLPTAGYGRQLEALNRHQVVTNSEQKWGGPGAGYSGAPSTARVIETATGTAARQVPIDDPVVITTSQESILIRPTWPPNGATDKSWVVDGATSRRVPLTGYDQINHFFNIRYAPSLFALRGGEDKPWLGKWVVRIETKAQRRNAERVERLFALEWDRKRGAQLMGGPGVFVESGSSAAIVHTGYVHNGAGLQPGDAFVVRRSYPSGKLEWQYTADCQATGIDEQFGTVHVCFADGRLVRLDSTTGAVRSDQLVRVGGHPVVPLSLSCRPDGAVYVGTMDGRILLVD